MRRGGQRWRVGWVGALLCVLLSAVAWGQGRPTPVRVADAVCAGCHREIVERYLASPMANGSGVAEDRLREGEVRHAGSGVAYRVVRGKDGAEMEFSGTGGLKGERRLEYFLGSGSLGTTYLYREGGYLEELPVAWYSRLQGYAMAPGLAEVTAMPAALGMTAGCMRCHMSGVQTADAGSRDHFSGLPFLHGGITCEGCHGDAAAHVRSGGRAAVVNPRTLPATARDAVCSSCHLEGEVSVERRGRTVMDWRPGEELSRYLTHWVFSRDSTSRSVSETEELLASRCKQVSGDRMSCMSCHDAHGGPAAAEKVQFYRAKCLTCHGSKVEFVRTHFPEQPDCASCHMPKGGAVDTPHVAWTDHRLRKRPEAAGVGLTMSGLETGTAVGKSGEELETVYAGVEVQPRDVALAYYKAMEKGHPELMPRAWELLNQAAKGAAEPDAPVLLALAYLNGVKGRAPQAEVLLREVLRVEPENREAADDLATLLARAGRVEEATALWKAAFAKNEDVEGLGLHLAIGECAGGDRAGAEGTLRTVLRFSPGSRMAGERLRAMATGTEVCAGR